MMKNLNYFILITVIFTSCSVHQRSVTDHGGEGVENFIHSYYTTMSGRDWSSYRSFFADKAILTTIWQGAPEVEADIFTSTISEFIAQTKDGPDSQPIFEERPIEMEISRKGNLANAWVYYEAKFGTKENLMEWKGYDLFSLIKHEGNWHIASLTYISEE